MLNRRKVLFGAAALMAAALPAMPVMASDSRLLADILAGVSDALTRDYIRRHYQEGQPLELRRPPLHGRRVRPLLVEALRGAPRAEEAVRAREAAAASAASAAEARASGRPESSEGTGARQRQARRAQKRREARQLGRPPLTERRMMP